MGRVMTGSVKSCMLAFVKIVIHLVADVVRFAILLFRPMRSLQAANLFLRRQLALFKERGVKPRRIDAALHR